MAELNNGNINAYKNDISVLSNDYPDFFYSLLATFKIPKNDIDTLNHVIDWSSVQENFSFFFDFDGCEKSISSMLSNSLLAKEKSIIIEMGFDEPVIEVKTGTFINHWYDFFAASGFMGIAVISQSGKYFMEFTDRDFMLHSNFKIENV